MAVVGSWLSLTHGCGGVGQDTVTFRVDSDQYEQVVALWHTHGRAGPGRALFSPMDRQLVRTTGLPFYLITADGDVKVLRPEALKHGLELVRMPGSALRAPSGAARGVLLGRIEARSTRADVCPG